MIKRVVGFREMAKAAGMKPEDLANRVRGLLLPKRCRDTKIISEVVIARINEVWSKRDCKRL